MDLYLKGKTAVVTGASQGLGKAITKELALEGVTVLAVARDEASLLELRSEIIEIGGVTPKILSQDLMAADGPDRVAAAALEQLGQIDILINNAGRSQPLGIIGAEEAWEESMTLDFKNHRRLTQLLLPQFISKRNGAILNLASTYELRSINASAVAKASLIVWSKQLSSQVAKDGITVNCLQPGIIDSKQIRRLFSEEERIKFSEQEIPMGNFGKPEDIANMAVFLVSPRASYITGTVAVVDGGMRRYAF